MFWTKKKRDRKVNEQQLRRMKMQIEMVDVLLKSGYTWSDIDNAIGFSEVSIRFIQSIIEKRNNC